MILANPYSLLYWDLLLFILYFAFSIPRHLYYLVSGSCVFFSLYVCALSGYQHHTEKKKTKNHSIKDVCIFILPRRRFAVWVLMNSNLEFYWYFCNWLVFSSTYFSFKILFFLVFLCLTHFFIMFPIYTSRKNEKTVKQFLLYVHLGWVA